MEDAMTNPTTQPAAGMYQTPNGDIFKVQVSKQSGHPYAKHLRPIGGQRLTVDDARINFEFVYAPGAVQALRPEMLMTVEAARAFGIRYGVCCVCGAFLKDATSVATGIGPVCEARMFGTKRPAKKMAGKNQAAPVATAEGAA